LNIDDLRRIIMKEYEIGEEFVWNGGI